MAIWTRRLISLLHMKCNALWNVLLSKITAMFICKDIWLCIILPYTSCMSRRTPSVMSCVPLRCTRLCPHALDKEEGAEKQGPVTLNPRHMRKAFKVMNELRRWCTLLPFSVPLGDSFKCVTSLPSVSSMPTQPELVVRRDHRGGGCRDRCSQGGSGCWEPVLPRYVHRWGLVAIHSGSCFTLCFSFVVVVVAMSSMIMDVY